MMKLNPKHVTFCPGCPKKELVLDVNPKFVLPSAPDTKKINVVGKKVVKKGNINSLF